MRDLRRDAYGSLLQLDPMIHYEKAVRPRRVRPGPRPELKAKVLSWVSRSASIYES